MDLLSSELFMDFPWNFPLPLYQDHFIPPAPLWSSSHREVQLSIIFYFREQYVLAKSDGFGMDEKVSKEDLLFLELNVL